MTGLKIIDSTSAQPTSRNLEISCARKQVLSFSKAVSLAYNRIEAAPFGKSLVPSKSWPGQTKSIILRPVMCIPRGYWRKRMTEIVKLKRKTSNVERIGLEREVVAKLDQWLVQLTTKFHGLKMKRRDLAEWILLNHAPYLSDEETDRIGEKFYDQVHLAKWILAQAKQAKASGKSVSLDQILRIATPKGDEKA